MHEEPFEKVQQNYFYSIYKCTVLLKLKILTLQMFSKNALLLKLVKTRKITRMKTKKRTFHRS